MIDYGIVTIVQCRAGSSRLKGKAFMKLAGRSLLSHVLERAAAIGFPVVLATSVNSRDDRVAKTGKKHPVDVYRGEEQDVLGRMSEAAKAMNAKIVVRVTGDCPLLAPDVARDVVMLYNQHGRSICTNDTANSGWPDGLDVEVFQAADLHEASEMATGSTEREHVTPWLRRRLPHVVLPGPAGVPAIKLSVDTQADFDRVAAIYAHLAPGELDWAATLAAARLVDAAMRAGPGALKKAGARA